MSPRSYISIWLAKVPFERQHLLEGAPAPIDTTPATAACSEGHADTVMPPFISALQHQTVVHELPVVSGPMQVQRRVGTLMPIITAPQQAAGTMQHFIVQQQQQQQQQPPPPLPAVVIQQARQGLHAAPVPAPVRVSCDSLTSCVAAVLFAD